MATSLPMAQEVVERTFSAEGLKEIERLCTRYPQKRAALLPALRVAEREFGSIDAGAMKAVAEQLDLTPAYVMGTVSFYTHFRKPTDGTYIVEVCRTLPCALRGSDAFAKHAEQTLGIKLGETTADGLFTLKDAECMAACDKAPVCQVNGYYHENLDAKEKFALFDELVGFLRDEAKKAKDGEEPKLDPQKGFNKGHYVNKAADPKAERTKPEGERDYEYEGATHDGVLLKRCYGDSWTRFADYKKDGGYEAYKKALAKTPDEVIEDVKKSGLRGRGGAGFPSGLKFSFVPKPEQNAGSRYLVINADESEPGTFKDRRLMENDPHHLLEGIVIASHAIHAEHCYIYIRGEMRYGAEVLELAVKEAYDNGIFGPNALGQGRPLDCTVHRGAGAYICGEETSLLSSLEGGRGYPRLKPPFPAVKGLWERPTIVNNVETIVNLAVLYKHGLDWYTSLGTPPKSAEEAPPRGTAGSMGPKVWCVSGHVNRPGLYDVPFGVSLKTLLMDEKYCGGIRGGRKLKAVVPGGSSMKILTADEIDVPLCFDAIAAAGSSIGSAGIIVMDETTSIPAALWNVLRFYHHESCGQCTPCREGSGWLEKILYRICHGMGTLEDLEAINKIADQACGKTICVFAEAFSWPAQSYIEKFRDEFVAAIKGAGPFPLKVCADD